jgi:hypothetical protein
MGTLKQVIFSTCSFLAFFVTTLNTYAQQKELKGGVIASESKLALPYVDLSIPAKGISTISNEDGIFDLKFSANDISGDSIIFSCVGYKSQVISVNDALKQKDLVIALTELTVELKEVVIKPISIKDLLDSISRRNNAAFNSPMKLNGYYREFVFTNAKCNEYADALFEYYYAANLKNSGQLKITASRCEKAERKNEKNKNFEAFVDSKVNPDRLFSFSLLADMIKQFFPDKQLDEYQYNIEGNNINKDMLITIYPKAGSERVYKLQFLTSDDLLLRSYKVEIPANLLKNVKERSVLGIHVKITAFTFEGRYRANDNGIYPYYFRVIKDVKVTGKFLGTVLDQTISQKSEFIVTKIDTKNISPITKSEMYKKGNLCDNGVAINTALLKSYNFIPPTKKDSLTISSIAKDISDN